MRAEVLDYINSLSLGTFIPTQELPWDSDGTPLYLKNPKKVYVDVTEYTSEPVVVTLDSLRIHNEVSTVRVYFACDAKVLPSNYDEVVRDLRGVKDMTYDEVNNRVVNVTTSFQADMLVTELEIRFTKLST